jgi:hypothetical protein
LREVITQIVKKTEPVDHIKLLGEIYGFLQSTCPEGMADEAFRVVPEPLRAQAIAPYAKPCDQSGERVRHTPSPEQIAEWREKFALGLQINLRDLNDSGNFAAIGLEREFRGYLRRCTEQAPEIAELKAKLSEAESKIEGAKIAFENIIVANDSNMATLMPLAKFGAMVMRDFSALTATKINNHALSQDFIVSGHKVKPNIEATITKLLKD